VTDTNLIGIEVHRYRLPHQQEVHDVRCACLYCGGIRNVDVTDFSPNADYTSTNMAVGAIGSSDRETGVACYKRISNLSIFSANRVRLESTTDMPLQMFEFQILSSGQNVALTGAATQSSMYRNMDKMAASKSIDNLNTTFSHTELGANQYWEVTLPQKHDVEEISIINRFCAGVADVNGCLCRLSNARITLYEDADVVATRQLGNTCDNS
jgi:hypothetical protein